MHEMGPRGQVQFAKKPAAKFEPATDELIDNVNGAAKGTADRDFGFQEGTVFY